MAKKKQIDVDDACPFPPGVELPRKGRLSAISDSIFADPRFVGSALLVAGMIFILGLTLAPPPIIKLPGNPSTWNTSLPDWILPQHFDNSSPWKPRYSNVTSLKESIVLQGNQVLLIQDCSCAINGTILVKDQAKLILRNADVSIRYKGGYTWLDPIPTAFNIKFIDNASFEAVNSTIYYIRDSPKFGFYNQSISKVTNSNLSQLTFEGYGDSQLTFTGSGANLIWIGENTQLTLNSSHVFDVQPATYDEDGFIGARIKLDQLRLKATDSSIERVKTYYLNSTIKITKSISGYHESWSSEDIAEGGTGFKISLTRCNVSSFSIMTEGSEIEITNVLDLGGLESTWGKIKLVNCTIPFVATSGGGVVDGCVIGVFDVIDGNYSLSRSRFRELYMNPVNDEIIFSSMKMYSLSGNYVNCSLSGDLMIENATDCRLLGHSKISRSYPVQVLNGDRAAPGVNLSVYNSTDDVLWSGKTDDLGKVNVSITFYQNLRVGGPETPRFPDKLRLVTSEGSDKKEAILELTSSTPILIVFPTLEKPVWTQGWFLQLFSAGLALAVVFAFLLSRRRGRM